MATRSRGNWLLWSGFGMMVAAVALALAAAFFGARPWGASATSVNDLSGARSVVERAVSSYGDPDLKVGEVMEFSNNYYAEVRERDTGTFAMELLVDKRTGRVYPEPGPNMMWNTKYGMMGGASQVDSDNRMPIGPDQATRIANDYLERVSPGTRTEEPDAFYGYYTLHTERNGEITGMLSVNGYSGDVWYHGWHGSFMAMDEE